MEYLLRIATAILYRIRNHSDQENKGKERSEEMNDIEKTRERIEALLRKRYPNSNFREDMVQIALIEVANGATIYDGIAEAKRQERKWNKPKRLYGEATFSNLDLAGLNALKAIQQDTRSKTCLEILELIAMLPIKTLQTVTGKSYNWTRVRKQQAQRFLEGEPEVTVWSRA